MLSLHEIRMVRNVSITRLGKQVGLSPMVISRLERGCYPFKLAPERVKKLAVGYGLSLKEFIKTLREADKRGTYRTIKAKDRKND